MEAVFHFFKSFKFVLSFSKEDLHMLESKFCLFPDNFYLSKWVGGIEMKAYSAQLELEVGGAWQ